MKYLLVKGDKSEQRYYQYAFLLSILTIVYNLVEGLVSIYFGFQDETLTLFGFGVDSFIEVISAIGITYMIFRIQRSPTSPRATFEVTALRITGASFYLLTAGLLLTIILNLSQQHKPETTLWGIIIALTSIISMSLLIHFKVQIGEALDSEPILADANCTRACLYMSILVLVASLLYELTGLAFIDSLGALGIAYFAFKEGRESFEKAQGKACSCSDDLCHN